MRPWYIRPGSALLTLTLTGLLVAAPVHAAMLGGGGNRAADCLATVEVADSAANGSRKAECDDGDAACDDDGQKDGVCSFLVRVCLNSTALEACTPSSTDAVTVAHAVDNGDRKFDPEFQALQSRIDALDLPDDYEADDCTAHTTLTVALKGPRRNGKMGRGRKKLKLSAYGVASGRALRDRDRILFRCRAGGDGRYLATELYSGSFDRVARQIFGPSCALSGCHDSESQAGGMVLLPNAAYSQTVSATPANAAAAADGLARIAPGEPGASLVYLKVTGELPASYGSRMPPTGRRVRGWLVEILRTWIIGDAVLGPAPSQGWVTGTDD